MKGSGSTKYLCSRGLYGGTEVRSSSVFNWIRYHPKLPLGRLKIYTRAHFKVGAFVGEPGGYWGRGVFVEVGALAVWRREPKIS